MEAETVFRRLSELERSFSELYAGWSAGFEGDDEAAALFAKMANDERGHRSLVDYQRRMLQRSSTAPREVDVDLGEIESTIREIAAVRSAPMPSLEAAVRLAMRFEASAVQGHYRVLVGKVDPELGRLLTHLGGEDRTHLDRLKGFAAARGIAGDPAATA